MRKVRKLIRFSASPTYISLRRVFYMAPLALGLGALLTISGIHPLLARGSSEIVGSASSTTHAAVDAPEASHLTRPASSESTPASSTSSVSRSSIAPTSPSATVPSSIPAVSCTLNMSSQLSDYNAEVAKQKQRLDQQLTHLLDYLIHDEYLAEYNASVTEVLTNYTATAAANHCTFPVRLPATLPNSYTP